MREPSRFIGVNAFHPLLVRGFAIPAFGRLVGNPSGRDRIDQNSVAGPFDRELGASDFAKRRLGRRVLPTAGTPNSQLTRRSKTMFDDPPGLFWSRKAARDRAARASWAAVRFTAIASSHASRLKFSARSGRRHARVVHQDVDRRPIAAVVSAITRSKVISRGQRRRRFQQP